MTREEAIKELKLIARRQNKKVTMWNDRREAVDMAIEALSAEVGQHGEWKRVSADKYVQHAHHFYRCDKCGYDHIGKTNFCPNCGARMNIEDGEA